MVLPNAFPSYFESGTIVLTIQGIMNYNYVKRSSQSFEVYLLSASSFLVESTTENLYYQTVPKSISGLRINFTD